MMLGEDATENGFGSSFCVIAFLFEFFFQNLVYLFCDNFPKNDIGFFNGNQRG